MAKTYFVYILTNKNNTVLYTGVTSDLRKRVFQHKQGVVSGFTRRYRCCKLVYHEATEDVHSAIAREKQIKAGPRRRKIDLLQSMNREWQDLYHFFDAGD
jgi:putative endonuclease